MFTRGFAAEDLDYVGVDKLISSDKAPPHQCMNVLLSYACFAIKIGNRLNISGHLWLEAGIEIWMGCREDLVLIQRLIARY